MPAPSAPVPAPLVPAGIKLDNPDVPENFLQTSQSLRQEKVEPNLAAVAPEVTNDGMGEDGSNKKKGKGKKPQGAKAAVLEVDSDPIENSDCEETLEEEEDEGGEEEEGEEDEVVEPPPLPAKKAAAPKKTPGKAKAVVAVVVTGQGGGKATAKKVGKDGKGKDVKTAKDKAEVTATAKGKAKAKPGGKAIAPTAVKVADVLKVKKQDVKQTKKGGKGKGKSKAKAKAKAVTLPPPPADDTESEPCYDGLTYPEKMALFLSKHKERSLWLSSDVRREAIENMDATERKRRRL